MPSMDSVISAFLDKTKHCPDFVCVFCHRLMYRQTVLPLNRDKYKNAKKSLLDIVIGDDTLYASFNGAYYVCRTCDSALSRGHMPFQSVANSLRLSPVPPQLSCLNKLEIRLACLRVAFSKIVALPSGKQRCIHGPAVNIPMKVDTVATTLPRLPNEAQLIPVRLKRKQCYKSHYMYDFVTPEKVLEALRWLKIHHPNVKINDDWCKECQKREFDLHAGFVKSCVEQGKSTVEKPQLLVKECESDKGSPTELNSTTSSQIE